MSLIPFFSIAQEVKGVVYTEEAVPLEGVLVINIKTGNKSYTNSKGYFEIAVEATEEVRFVKKGYERISHVVRQSDFGEELRFKMKYSVVEIDEIAFTKVSKEKLEDLKKSIGLPEFKGKRREKGEVVKTRDVLLPLLVGGLNIQAINDLINGDSRRRKNLYKYEDFQEDVHFVRNGMGERFFIDAGVPENRISECITFAITEKSEMKYHIKKRDLFKIENVLKTVLPTYLGRLEKSTK